MFNLNLFLKSEEIQSGKEPMDLYTSNEELLQHQNELGESTFKDNGACS